MKLSDFIERRGIWIFPFGATSFVFALLLLVASSLPDPIRQWTLPSLGVYLIGLANIIFLKELFHTRYRDHLKQDVNLPTGILWIFLSLHIIWFFGLIAYNVWKGVL